MKAVILAAGEGTRMWPLAENRPKHLLPVGNRTIISNILHALVENAVTQVYIVVGFKGEMIRSALEDSEHLGLQIEYVKQKKWNGTASALNLAFDALGQEPFLAIYGDLWLNASAIKSVVEKSRHYPRVMGVVHVNDPSRFGFIELDGDKLARIVEKPRTKVGDGYVNSGVYFLDSELFEAIRKTPRSKRAEYELTTSLQRLLDAGNEIGGAEIAEPDWVDVGRPWDLLEANSRALSSLTGPIGGKVESTAVINGPVLVEEGAIVESCSHLDGPVYVGKNCHIGPNARIRPSTCLEAGVHVGSSCEIKNSVIMKGTKIPHLSYVGDSIVGERCNFGAGTITANIRFDEKTIRMRVKDRVENTGRRKLGAIIGDRVQTGINVSLLPGVKVGSDSWIGPGTIVDADIPSGQMVISRSTVSKRTKRMRRS